MPLLEPAGSQAEGAVAERLCWRSLPVVDDYPSSLCLVALVVLACVGAGLSFGGLGYGLLAAALLGLSLASYFVPTRYELDEAGVRSRFAGHSRRMRWDEVRRVSVAKGGVHLSPFERPSRLDSFRGILLRFAGNRDEVIRFVDRQVAATR
jgi:hypothetical protein